MKDKFKKCKSGECVNADVALLGCYLLRVGIVREEKEKIKDKVFDIIIAHRKNAIKTGKVDV
jgi:hypothetical protein